MIFLVVDDSAAKAQMMVCRLHFEGHEAHWTSNPLEVLLAINTIDPDVVLLDVCMPGAGLSSAGVSDAIRKSFPAQNVLLWSSIPVTKLAEVGREYGRQYVSKGATTAEIISAIEGGSNDK